MVKIPPNIKDDNLGIVCETSDEVEKLKVAFQEVNLFCTKWMIKNKPAIYYPYRKTYAELDYIKNKEYVYIYFKDLEKINNIFIL